MKRILGFLLLTGCVTPNVNQQKDRIFQLGDVGAKFKAGHAVDLQEQDWQGIKTPCITHIYRCEIDQNGKVSGIKALDISSPTFQNFTEEALRTWEFEPGKAGSCFVQYAYERKQPSQILILSESWALKMADNLAKNRSAFPVKDGKNFPTNVSQRKPTMPREAALRGIEGFAVYHFQIDDEGTPNNPVLVRSYPEGMFEKAALDAIKGWRYASLKDEPNSQRHSTVTIQFQLVGQNHISSCDYGFERNKLADGAAGTP